MHANVPLLCPPFKKYTPTHYLSTVLHYIALRTWAASCLHKHLHILSIALSVFWWQLEFNFSNKNRLENPTQTERK